jgi:hypothetical protein
VATGRSSGAECTFERRSGPERRPAGPRAQRRGAPVDRALGAARAGIAQPARCRPLKRPGWAPKLPARLDFMQFVANRSKHRATLHTVRFDATTRRQQPGEVMNTVSIPSRLISAAMAAVCSLALLATVGQQLNPSRLAQSPQVVQLEPVVVTAPAHTVAAAIAAPTATN